MYLFNSSSIRRFVSLYRPHLAAGVPLLSPLPELAPPSLGLLRALALALAHVPPLVQVSNLQELPLSPPLRRQVLPVLQVRANPPSPLPLLFPLFLFPSRLQLLFYRLQHLLS